MTKHISLFLVAMLAAFSIMQADVAAAPPNIVFFLVDDLGWRDLACYGSGFYETPNIDAMAREGVRFTDAYAACHVCSPTRASILTGKYPARLGLTDWLPGRKEFDFQKLHNAEVAQFLPLEEVTLAEALKAHGYRTGHFGKWHLGEEPYGPLAQGFDVQVPKYNKGWPNKGYYSPFGLEGIEDREGTYLTDRLTDEALKFIEAAQDQPFFLYLAHFAVHDPIQGRPDLVSKYEQKLQGMPPRSGAPFILEGNPDVAAPLTREMLDALLQDEAYGGYSVLPQRTVKIKQHQDNVQFAAMVESMDESLGRVLDKLNALGLADNTIVILTSDNGGMSAANFGNPERVVDPEKLNTAFSTSNLPLRGGKGWLYEGGIRVPLIVRWPGQGEHGVVCTTPVVSTDFFPSVLDMAGLPLLPQQHVDGVSIAPLLRGEDDLDREAIYWHFPQYSNHGMQSPGGAIRVGDFKLLDYFEENTVQMFNLREDPGEQRDLAPAQPQKAAALQEKLRAWRDTVEAQMPTPNPDYAPRDNTATP